MKETLLYAGIIAALGALIAVEGIRGASLDAQLPVTAKELYASLAQANVRIQIVDARTSEAYEDTHIPGAIPFPGCTDVNASTAALAHILRSVPTVIVSDDGARASFDACRSHFRFAKNLAEGMSAWIDAGLPEDSGEYTPPKASAGGGCL